MEMLTGQLQYQRLQSYQSLNTLILSCLKNLLSCFGRTIVICLECTIGLHMGAVAGWISGWCIALAYKCYCEPTHFISIDLITRWHYLPYEYGRYGMISGAVLGALTTLLIILQKSVTKREL